MMHVSRVSSPWPTAKLFFFLSLILHPSDQVNKFASSLREIRKKSVMTEQPSETSTVEESSKVSSVKQLESVSSTGSNTPEQEQEQEQEQAQEQGPQRVQATRTMEVTQQAEESIGTDLAVTEEAAHHGSKRPKESKHGHYENQQQAKKQRKRLDLVDTEDDLKSAEYYYDNGMQPG